MVGVAVVGTGFGCLTHVRALRAAGFDVVALVGRDASKTAARAERFEIAARFENLGGVAGSFHRRGRRGLFEQRLLLGDLQNAPASRLDRRGARTTAKTSVRSAGSRLQLITFLR